MKNDCSECGNEWKACHYDRIYPKRDFCEYIDDAPTVYPKMGKWVIRVIWPPDGEDCYCSECGKGECLPYWKYCPNCGAKMEAEDGTVN